MGVNGARWPSRSSKPLRGGGPVAGGFDSHALPPKMPSLAFCRKAKHLAGQVPVAYFAARWLPRTPWQALLVLVLQALAAFLAVTIVLVFESPV